MNAAIPPATELGNNPAVDIVSANRFYEALNAIESFIGRDNLRVLQSDGNITVELLPGPIPLHAPPSTR